MPAKPTKGTKQLSFELPEALVDEAKEFAEKRGEKLREVVSHALRRHMDNPPPLPVLPPLPPVASAPDPAPSAKKKR
jgi:hypothetical protein